MRVLILGATGLIGDKFYKYFNAISNSGKFDIVLKGTYLTIPVNGIDQLDLKNTRETEKLFLDFAPDIVIQPAAVSNVEFCEENPGQSGELNIEATKFIANLCRNAGAKYVFFSTDYLFNGKKGNYSEKDMPDPLNEYGRQKLFIENYINENLRDFLIIRTTVVYGWEIKGKNFVFNLINKLSSGKNLKVPCDQIGNPTYAANLAEIVIELILKNRTGTYNVVGEETMDRYSFGKLVCSVFGLDESLLVPVMTEELGQKAARPLNSTLDISKLKSDISCEITSPIKGLRLMKEERYKE